MLQVSELNIYDISCNKWDGPWTKCFRDVLQHATALISHQNWLKGEYEVELAVKTSFCCFFLCFTPPINWHYEVTARLTHSHRDYPIQKAIWWLGSQPITHHWTTNHTYNNYTVSLFHSLVTSHQIRQWSCQVALVLPEVGTWMQGWTQRWVLKKQSKNPWRSGCFWGKMVVFNQQNIDIFGNKYGGLLMVQRDRYIYIWWYMIYMVVCWGWCTYLGISK